MYKLCSQFVLFLVTASPKYLLLKVTNIINTPLIKSDRYNKYCTKYNPKYESILFI